LNQKITYHTACYANQKDLCRQARRLAPDRWFEFPIRGMENSHTATPDDPYWSANGKAYAGIKEAAARGEITPEEAITAYRHLADAAK
jgi:hypothetical protein